MLNKNKFSKLMAITGEIFGKSASPETAMVYYQILKDFTDEAIEKAFYDVIKTHRFETFPKPADFLDKIPKKKSNDDAYENTQKLLKTYVR